MPSAVAKRQASFIMVKYYGNAYYFTHLKASASKKVAFPPK